MKGLSKTAIIGVIIVVIIAAIAAFFLLGQAPGGGGVKEYPVGALLPLSGDLASYGQNSKAAIEIALKEVNEYLAKKGADFRIKLLIEDTETKPEVALEKLKTLAAKGVKVVIGPQTSAEVRNLKGYADSNKILLISQSSTAPELAIPGDYVFRYCPDDTKQGPAIARTIWESGVRVIVVAWRGDAWGDGLKKAASDAFTKLGGQVIEGVRYNPEAKEFTAEVKSLADKVQEAVNQHGADKVGVLYIAFAEAVKFFEEASKYDVLKQVKWFGSDGTALLDEIVKSPVASEFAEKTAFINPIFAATKSPKYDKLVKAVEAKVGRKPDTYAVAAYDAVWTVALAIEKAGKYDADAVKAALPEVLKDYFGASGKIVLNEAGDRASADYELWIVKNGEWVLAGIWKFQEDKVQWFQKPW